MANRPEPYWGGSQGGGKGKGKDKNDDKGKGKDEKGKGQGQEGRDEQDSVGSSSMSEDTVRCPHCHRTFSLYHSDSSDAGKGSGKDGKGVFEPEAEPSTGGGKCGGKGDGTGDGTGSGKAAANAPTQEKTQCFLVATVSLMIQLNHERQLLEQAHRRQLAKQRAARDEVCRGSGI